MLSLSSQFPAPCSELTDDADKVAPLVVLEDPVVAVSVGDEEEIGRVGDGDGRRGAEVSLVDARNESLAEDEVGLRTVDRQLKFDEVALE
jgi:hypothetical protein